jgi:L-fuculose-phosphate aldolase
MYFHDAKLDGMAYDDIGLSIPFALTCSKEALMRFDCLHPADQLVMMMQRIYRYGMTTTTGGNLSVRDENGDVWITPSGIDKGSLTRADMVQIKPDGTQAGIHRPSVELPLHLRIYQLRPDLRAVLHAHPPTMVAFSLVRRPPSLRLIPDVQDICGRVGVAKYAVPGSELLGENIAGCFADGCNTVLMENHGCVVGAGNLLEAFMAFETLDFSGRMELEALKLGLPRFLSDRQLQEYVKLKDSNPEAFEPEVAASAERAARRDMCGFIHRSYDQRLFTAAQGALSLRLDKNDFLINPLGRDRRTLQPEDMALIRDGLCQAGKAPSRCMPLHRAIYDAHPDIGCVLTARPPSIMAFAVTGTPFDSRLIPESYIALRSVKKLPFLSSVKDVPGTVGMLGPRSPVLLIENEGVVVTGRDLLNAFDRLEVLEYSARAVIAARDIGRVVQIDEAQVREIEQVFHLE